MMQDQDDRAVPVYLGAFVTNLHIIWTYSKQDTKSII